MAVRAKTMLASVALLLIASGVQADSFSKVYSAVTIKVEKFDCPIDQYRAVVEHKKGKRLHWTPSECTGVFVQEGIDDDGILRSFVIRWANVSIQVGSTPTVTLNLDDLDENDGDLYIESFSPVSLPIRLSNGDGPYGLFTNIGVKRFPYGANNPDEVNTLSVGVSLGPLSAEPEDRLGAEERLLSALGSGQLESAPIIILKRNK